MSSYVVLDLEMCMVSEDEMCEEYRWKSELIQIGAVRLDDNLEIADSFVTYVHPQYGSVSPFITNLTGITRENTKDAPGADEALRRFAEWLPDDTVLVTWSESDETQLTNEMYWKGISIPRLDAFLDDYIDCQITFSDKMDSRKTYKLSEALNISGIYSEIGEHDALIDAKNTALLFAKMEREPELVLSPYYVREGEVTHATYNPFADLLKKCCTPD